MQILRSEGSLSVTLNKTWLSTHCKQKQHSPFLKALTHECSGCLIKKNKSEIGGYIEGHELRYLMTVRKSKTDVDLLIFYCIPDSTTRQHSRGKLYLCRNRLVVTVIIFIPNKVLYKLVLECFQKIRKLYLKIQCVKNTIFLQLVDRGKQMHWRIICESENRNSNQNLASWTIERELNTELRSSKHSLLKPILINNLPTSKLCRFSRMMSASARKKFKQKTTALSKNCWPLNGFHFFLTLELRVPFLSGSVTSLIPM